MVCSRTSRPSRARVARLKKIEEMAEDGTFEVLPKKEVIQLKREQEKLEKNLGGIKEMQDIPDMIFVVDPRKERICIQEAHTLGIPLVGICDTNCDPEELDYVIPGNDDAIRAVKLIVSKMADARYRRQSGTGCRSCRRRRGSCRGRSLILNAGSIRLSLHLAGRGIFV